MTREEKVFDILDKWEFFYGQRAGRELWGVKPKTVQDRDIANFNRDMEIVRSALRPVSREQVYRVWKGEWEEVPWSSKYRYPIIKCSKCGFTTDVDDDVVFDFCPRCGAVMNDDALDDVIKRLEELHENK